MKECIDIIIPEDKIAKNDEEKERLDKAHNFQPVDRIPVIIGANQWVTLAARGCLFAEYIRSPRDNLRGQILNYKWHVENIHDDQPIATEFLTVEPDFGCLRGTEFPMEITWLDNQPPKCRHPLTEPEQIDKLELPEPDSGLNAKKIEWYRDMSNLVEDFEVRLNGQPLKIQITLSQPGGPIPSAFALAGSNLFLWMLTEPDRIHRLMDIVTRSHIQCIAFFDEMAGRNPKHSVGMGADAAEMISPEAFREFVVPYYLRVWEVYQGVRSLHMCGQINHLLDILRDDLGVSLLDGFGFPVDRNLLAEKMAGRVCLAGGPNPTLIMSGPRKEIISECIDYIKKLGNQGSYILDCRGTAAGTPPENIEAIVEASKQAGRFVNSFK